MDEEEKKCYVETFEKVDNVNYQKVKKEVPCNKKRCKNGQLAKPSQDGRYYCKDDSRNG